MFAARLGPVAEEHLEDAESDADSDGDVGDVSDEEVAIGEEVGDVAAAEPGSGEEAVDVGCVKLRRRSLCGFQAAVAVWA